jgi:HlyD family secretion protein
MLAAEQFSVSFQQVGGRVTEVLVREGQFVERGATLMRLDPYDLDQQIRGLEAQMTTVNNQIAQTRASIHDYDINIQETAIATAQSTLASIQSNYDRVAFLYSEGAATEVALEEAHLRLITAENALRQSGEALEKLEYNVATLEMSIPVLESQRRVLEVQRSTLQEQKNRLVLRAPVDGLVLRVVPKSGENVAPNAPVVILQSKEYYFDIYVPETMVTRFTVGAPIPLRLIATGEELPGVIQYIVSAPQYTSNRMSRDNAQGDLASFQIRIALEGNTDHLLPGMTVEVDVYGTD